MKHEQLLKHLTEQRYQILVSIRPLASARIAWNKAIQALLDTLLDSYPEWTHDYEEQKQALRALMFEITL